MGISSYIHVHYPIYKYETVYKTYTIKHTDTIIYTDINAIYEHVGMKKIPKKQLPESDIFEQLSKLENTSIDTKLQSDSTVLELEPVPFSADDWEKIKESYYTWRRSEFKKGNYKEDLWERADWEEIKDYTKEEKYIKIKDDDTLLYVNKLPRIPKKIKHNEDLFRENYIDTLMADLNFDGKLDVIFKIELLECEIMSNYAPLDSTEYHSFISKGDEYVIEHEGAINKAIKNLHRFNNVIYGDIYYTKTEYIEAVSVENGIVIISGKSELRDWGSSRCCPNYGFEYKFNCYMDKSGKGYADIKGIYRDNRTGGKQTFKIKYAYAGD